MSQADYFEMNPSPYFHKFCRFFRTCGTFYLMISIALLGICYFVYSTGIIPYNSSNTQTMYHYVISNETTSTLAYVPPEECQVEEWNLKSTDSFPFRSEFQAFAAAKLTALSSFGGGQMRLLSALVYEEYIVVTTTMQIVENIGKPVHCRYFDCHRQELPESSFKSFFFPMTVVHCARRAGAVYMSLTMTADEVPQEPIPIVKRIFKQTPHEIGVCVGQIYGAEKKWLEITEFVEHHRLIGATMFYFTIFEMDGYTRKVIENYERLGLAEATFSHTEYAIINFLFQQIQLNECFFRSKFHSKWVINVDPDERLTLNNDFQLPAFLRRQDPSVCELIFGIRRIPKFHLAPDRYHNETQLLKDMLFLRYRKTTDPSWVAPKTMFRPDKVHAIYMHWTWRQHEKCRIYSVPNHVAYIRHYRIVNTEGPGKNWVMKNHTFSNFPLNSNFSEKLTETVLEQVNYLYKLKSIPCTEINSFFHRLFKNDTLLCAK